MTTRRRGVGLSLALGAVSLVAVGISHLALTDIAHGDGGAAEWLALQLSFASIIAFQLSALTTLWRIRRERETLVDRRN
jgi:hypothetical protein